MPYSKNAQYSTYSTKRFPLVKDVFLRSTDSFDAIYTNCVIETVENKTTKQLDIAAAKRPGTTTLIDSAAITAEFRGMFFWELQNTLIYVIGNTFYFRNMTTGTTTSSASLTTSTGDVGFVEFLYSTGTVTVVWTDGTKLGEISDTFVVTTSSDTDIPSPHIPAPVFIDGYIFLAKSNSQDIYNSDNDAPLAWTSGEVISAEIGPDQLVTIEKLSNYILAFGRTSVEYFYDAGNASGSPLGRNDTFFKNIGYIGGKAKVDNKIYFIGKSTNGNLDIFVAEDSKIAPINNQQVNRFLARQTNLSNITGSMVTWDGNTYYIFTVNGKTFSYNVNTDFFSNWVLAGGTGFSVKYSNVARLSTNLQSYMYLPETNRLVYFSTDDWRDSGTPFQFLIRTENEDFDTLNMKFIGRMSLYTDRGNTNATIGLQWSDNDYQTYSNVYPIVLNQELPSIRRLGGFRRRSFKFTNQENYPIRFRGYEIDINMGDS